MEITLPENHSDMKRIVEVAHDDFAPAPVKGKCNSLSDALYAARGNAPGSGDDLDNIEFLIHVLSVNRAASAVKQRAKLSRFPG